MPGLEEPASLPIHHMPGRSYPSTGVDSGDQLEITGHSYLKISIIHRDLILRQIHKPNMR